jgi:acylphosphatase
VQGVNYRNSARERALALGITGWVRNVSGGHVEIIAEGDKFNIGSFIVWCETGPRWASVDELKVSEESPTGEFTVFAIVRDG